MLIQRSRKRRRRKKNESVTDWKHLLKQYLQDKGRHLKPIRLRNPQAKVPQDTHCPHCQAPADYLYFNDGKKRQQIKCKLCNCLFQSHPRFRKEAKYSCPHCHHPLYTWKHNKAMTIYKCGNDQCSEYLKRKDALNPLEKLIQTVKSSQYKLRYQYREYHFTQEQLSHSAPLQGEDTGIFRIYHNLHTLCLILTFHVSLAISSRKTAYILANVFEIPATYQTVLNYAKHVAPFCHRFNLAHKGPAETTQVGDETYIKILGKFAYVFFFLSPQRRSISAYHIDHSRDTLPATIAMKEALRTAPKEQPINIISDGNPAYQAGIHFLNKERSQNAKIQNTKVVGLQNLDDVSEEFRPFKQLIERLNRTYKFHVRPANGFNSPNGSIVLTTLFVTFYNFIRPHQSLSYAPPIPIDELKGIKTIQGKWAQILQMAFQL